MHGRRRLHPRCGATRRMPRRSRRTNHLAFSEDGRADEEILFNRQFGPRRGHDPAALRLDRRDGVPRHGHARAAILSSSPCSATAPSSAAERTVLRAGDTLLLQGTWKALDVQLDDPDVLVVDSPGAGAPAGRAAWGRAQAGHRRSSRHGGAAGHGRSSRRPSPALLAAGALVLTRCRDRRAGLSRRSTGRRSSWSAP